MNYRWLKMIIDASRSKYMIIDESEMIIDEL